MQQISTAVRRREAVVYAELAGVAHDGGFPRITASQVHEWVMDGLLPPTGEQRSAGRHGFETIRLAGAEAQLLALCRLRAQTKSRDRLAILLWLDSWPIGTDRLRRAILKEIGDPTRVTLNTSGDETLDRMDEYARRHGPAFSRRAGLGHVGPEAAANGTMAALGVTFGVAEWDEEAAQAIEHIAGLDRARTDIVGDAGPWLDGPAAPSVDLSGFAFRAVESVKGATESELEKARRRARPMVVDMQLVVRATELGLGLNVAGLGVLARGRLNPGMAVAIALVFGNIGLGDQLDTLAQTWSAVASEVAPMLPVAEAYVAKHPEQRDAIRRGGIQALLERGEVVPLEPAEVQALLSKEVSRERVTPPVAE